MKVFVATKEGQGRRTSDFFFCEEGELVNFGFECDNDKNVDIDKGCGCQRAVVGFSSHKGGTTFRVEERPISKAEYVAILQCSHADAGWNFPPESDFSTESEALELLTLAKMFEVGVVLERRGPEIRVRAI